MQTLISLYYFAIQTFWASAVCENQSVPVAPLSKEGPKEFETPNEHGEQLFHRVSLQVLLTCESFAQ